MSASRSRVFWLLAAGACHPDAPIDPSSGTPTPTPTPLQGFGTLQAHATGLPTVESIILDLVLEIRVDGELVMSPVANRMDFGYLHVPTGQVELAVVDGGWYDPSAGGGSGIYGFHDGSGTGCTGSASGTLEPNRMLVLTPLVTCIAPTD